MKKYELTDNFKMYLGRKLFQIRALVDISDVAEAGETGGYIEKEENLDQCGNAWVSDDAWVFGKAWVRGKARVSGNAAAEKHIPDSARRQMAHRPYQKGECSNGKKETGSPIQSAKGTGRKTEIPDGNDSGAKKKI